MFWTDSIEVIITKNNYRYTIIPNYYKLTDYQHVEIKIKGTCQVTACSSLCDALGAPCSSTRRSSQMCDGNNNKYSSTMWEKVPIQLCLVIWGGIWVNLHSWGTWLQSIYRRGTVEAASEVHCRDIIFHMHQRTAGKQISWGRGCGFKFRDLMLSWHVRHGCSYLKDHFCGGKGFTEPYTVILEKWPFQFGLRYYKLIWAFPVALLSEHTVNRF